MDALSAHLQQYEAIGVRYVVAPAGMPIFSPAPALVFHDATASIYELPDAAPYAQAADPACKIDILDRQHIQTSCPQATVLTRREMFFPGWSATVDGLAVAVSESGLFQTVPVPAGTVVITFNYAPPEIGLACGMALGGLGVWLAVAARKRRKKALLF
jgi:hypothetical protein